MRFYVVILLISTVIVGCELNSKQNKISIKMEQTDLDKSPVEIVNKLKLIETWTLSILDSYDQFSTINKKQKDEIIKKLSEVYTNAAAEEMFLHQYRPKDGNYQRVPTDYLSIQHLKKQITIKKSIYPDEILIEITGKVEGGELLTALYHIDFPSYKLKSIEITSPY